MSRPRASAGAALVVAYLGAVWLVAQLPPLLGVARQALVGAVAFSPDDLVHGRLWLLPLSGLVVAGNTTAQLTGLGPVAACVVVLGGGGAFWRAAIAGHVGSTLAAYAIVAILLVVDGPAVRAVLGAPDYGISCVYAGALGALAVLAARRSRGPAAAVAVIAASLPMVDLLHSGLLTAGGTLRLATLEHGWAFVLGAAITATGSRAPAGDRPLPAAATRVGEPGGAGRAAGRRGGPGRWPARRRPSDASRCA